MLLWPPRPASAVVYTIGEMLQKCARLAEMRIDGPKISYPMTDAGWDAALCATYLQGIADMIVDVPLSQFNICMENTATKQHAAVFVKYANEHPERHHWAATYGVIDALAHAFPCPVAGAKQ
jgi:hypothetical protein